MGALLGRHAGRVGSSRRPIAVVLLVAALFSSTARANGRFPEAQAIETIPGGDGSTVFMRTTFGVLVSRDTGISWRWICERALGYDGQWDPSIAVTKDGRLWVGLEDGLASTPDGCTVDRSRELEGETVKDLTVDRTGETIWAITGRPGGPAGVWRRKPGARFEKLSVLEDTNLMTIEVAAPPSRRVYVSGQPWDSIRGRLHRSDDDGKTFTIDLGDAGANGLVADGPFFIGAIDPTDPARVLVRHLHAHGSDLLLTKDGGRTFENVLSMTSAMFGFAKSPDGSVVWAGSGLPEHGLFRSIDRGSHFDPVAKHGVLCLHAANSSLLFLCENAATLSAPAVAQTRDPAAATIRTLARFADVEGPVTCSDPDARASLCAGSWAETRMAFVEPSDAGAPPVASRARPPRNTTPARTRRSCACETASGAGHDADLRWLIAGVVALVARGHRRIMPGSKLPQR